MIAALSIAGSDSSGGAGIQADLKTFQAMGIYGSSAITAVTSQNTETVFDIQAVDPQIVRSQIRAVITDLPVKAAKTGMLFSKEIMTAFLEEWEQLKKYTKNIPLVVDPVMISTSGKRLIFEDAEKVYFEIFKTSRLITPNLPETSALLGTNIHHEKSLNDAAYELYRLSGTAVLVKGGHIENSNDALDVLYDGKEFSEFRSKMIESKNTHGTGCTLSAAIAAGLAMGMPLKESVKKGKDFVSGAILNAPGFGKGHGPLNHLWMHKGR